MSIKRIDYNEFLRSFAVRPDKSMSFLLGAGASVQAGIPTASSLIWEFKRKLYCSLNRIHEEQFRDLESERNRRILQDYFDSQECYPTLSSVDEYSFYFEKCYPKSIDRKFFIQRKVSNIHPSIGHRCLGVLMESHKVDSIWTTNFDELIESGLKIINASLSFVLISPENSENISELNSPYPKIIKLHGDYRYDPLQNTKPETQQLDEKLREEFTETSGDKGLIVVGYSGNDKSIIESINNSLKKGKAFPYGLVWCIRKNDVPKQELIELIEEADKRNELSGFLEIESFDEFLYELYSSCNVKNAEIESIAENLFEKRKAFKTRQADQSVEPIKLNGLIAKKYPKSLYTFESDLQNWKELREVIEGRKLIGALFGGKTYTFDELKEVKSAFENRIKSEIKIVDIEDKWLYSDQSFYLGMLYDLINHTLLKYYGLKKINLRSRQRGHLKIKESSEFAKKTCD